MHGAFADDEVIHRCSEAWLMLYNVGCKMHLFVTREIHKGYFNETHIVVTKVPLEVPHDCGVADMSPEVHCNLCNHCYTLGMPGPRPDIRCVQYLPKSST